MLHLRVLDGCCCIKQHSAGHLLPCTLPPLPRPLSSTAGVHTPLPCLNVPPCPSLSPSPQGFEMVRAIYIESPTNLCSVENDLLTPTFKLKRAPLQKRYQPEIDAMYAALKKA